MSEVKRYSVSFWKSEMEHDSEGWYVLYDDHLAEIARLKDLIKRISLRYEVDDFADEIAKLEGKGDE